MSPLRLFRVLLLIGCCSPADAQPLSPPPLGLGPPGPVIPPIERADPRLEAALRTRLFAGPLAVTPVVAGDPDHTEWEQARAMARRPPCSDVGPLRYLFNRIDLDGDTRLETVAVVVGSYACASGGCTLAIFREDERGELELVAENGLFQSPLKVISQRHRGWLDLTVPASLYGAPDGLLELRFDGRSYRPVPLTPQEQAAAPAGTVVLELLPLPFERLGRPLPCGP
jgi:hypothetical protein